MKVLSDDTGLVGREINPYFEFGGVDAQQNPFLNEEYLEFEKNNKPFHFTAPQQPNTVIECELVWQIFNERNNLWHINWDPGFKTFKEFSAYWASGNFTAKSRQAFEPKDTLKQGIINEDTVCPTCNKEKNFKFCSNAFHIIPELKDETVGSGLNLSQLEKDVDIFISNITDKDFNEFLDKREHTVEQLAEMYADRKPALFIDLNDAFKSGYYKGHQATIDKVLRIIEDAPIPNDWGQQTDLINQIKELKA